jgi:DNA invertase Pin-like site-specific DNA recombinase
VNGVIDVYARESRLGDERQRSPEGQVADCLGVLAERGLQSGEVHVDRGLSAWKPKVKRPGWNRLMQRLEAGEAAGVVVFDMERFSRQPDDGSRLIKAAERGLLILDSDAEYDLMSPSGRKSFRDALNVAEYFSMRLAARVARGKRMKALAGEPNGSKRPFGFERDRVTVREDEAAVLRELTRRLLDGEPQGTLVAELNERGLTTSSGAEWSVRVLKDVLMRQCNAGRVVYKGAVVAAMPGKPIVDGEDLDAVIALYAARRRGRPNSPAYLCSGVAVCSKCGKPLHGRPRSAMPAYPDGSVRRCYWCSAEGCKRVAIDQRGMDEAVGELVIEILSDPRRAAAIEAAVLQAETEAARLDRLIADAEQLADDLAARLGAGEMTRRRYDAAAGPLEARLARLQAERGAVKPQQPPPRAASRKAWERRWADATPEQRRSLLRTALGGRKLVVHPAKRAAGTFRFDPSRIAIE